MANITVSNDIHSLLQSEDKSSIQTFLEIPSSAADIGAAEDSVIGDYLGPVTLASAASISWDVANGVIAKLEDLAHDATVTLSNLADGATFSLAGTQDGTGGRSLTIAHSGLTVRGDTSGIASLDADDAFLISGIRKGDDLLVVVQTYAI